MKNKFDDITIELEVTAVQDDSEIWMQGDLAITINGERPYSIDDMIDEEVLLKSLDADGDFYIFSCICGEPKCGGWHQGIEVTHKGNSIKWADHKSNKSWLFDKNEINKDLELIHKEVKNFQKFFDDKNISYVGVGVGPGW